MAQPPNDTRQIINLKENTITLMNKTTNETISTAPYLSNTGNTITNETINNMTSPGNTGSTITNETINNMTSPGNTGNMSINLTEKFEALAK